MAYKVKYTTLALLEDGKAGNIPQGNETIYTDWPIDVIKAKIDESFFIKGKKLVAVIDLIERVEGSCLPSNI